MANIVRPVERSPPLIGSQGIRTDEDALIKAMNVAGDHIVEEYGVLVETVEVDSAVVGAQVSLTLALREDLLTA